MDRVASLDLGTNTFRLLVAEWNSSGRLTPVLLRRDITRLGGGFYQSGRLRRAAIAKSLKVLKQYAALLEEEGVAKRFAVATSVVREAENGREFLEKAGAILGEPPVLITAAEEAHLTLKGVGLSQRYREIGNALVFDIGGGSTEFVLARNRVPEEVMSLSLGVVHLTERFIRSDPPEPGHLAALRREVDRRLEAVDLGSMFKSLRSRECDHDLILVGTGGTPTTLAAIELALVEYEPSAVQDYVLGEGSIRKILGRLSRCRLKERRLIPGLQAGREDVILAGALIVLSVMELFGFDELTVCDSGILEGIALNGMERDR